MESSNTCNDCYKIICKRCGWNATDQDVIMIQQGKLHACPLCGWKPQATQSGTSL